MTEVGLRYKKAAAGSRWISKGGPGMVLEKAKTNFVQLVDGAAFGFLGSGSPTQDSIELVSETL